jgi:hypothetical protein
LLYIQEYKAFKNILTSVKMALQLLKRNYTMQGYERPKILKLPQGEMRWAPRRLPVDVGDVMMNIRMDDSKNKYIGEHVSKYAQGNNPYGQWGYPYKVNKNNIRPPIVDPKYYEPLSRMPVKFDAITAGPIVKDLYGKRVEIAKVAPQTIIDKVCPDARPRPSAKGDSYTDRSYSEGSIDLHLKQPRASIPYHPSMPIHMNTGVPDIELDAKIVARPNMGIHFPFHVSDQSRDINNMRTPMHVAVKPGYKDPYTFIPTNDPEIELEPGVQTAAQTNVNIPVPTVSNLNRDTVDLTPKVQTSAWYNPSYYLTDLGPSINGDITCIESDPIHTSMKAPSNYRMVDHGGHDVPISTRTALHTSRQTNVNSRLLRNGEIGSVALPDSINAGAFEAKASVPTVQQHQEYGRARETREKEYFFVQGQNTSQPQRQQQHQRAPRTGVRTRLQVQAPRVDRHGLEPAERLVPVGTGRFIQNTF